MAASLLNQLPPTRKEPLGKGRCALPRRRTGERRLLDQASGGADWFMLLKTGSRVDVGEWLCNGRVWLCATASGVVLVASGRVPFVQQIPFERLRESVYNHITGEVVFAPEKTLKLKRVKLAALDGYQLLAQIHGSTPSGQKKEMQHA